MVECLQEHKKVDLKSSSVAGGDRARSEADMADPVATIFISYAHADSPFVDRLEADLQQGGFVPWVDRRGLVGGQKWRRELQEAIDRSQVLLVVLSPEAVASPYVQVEYGYATDEGKILIPLYYRSCKVPMELRTIQWIDFQHSYEEGLTALLHALHKQSDSAIPLTSSDNQLSEPEQSAREQAPAVLPPALSPMSQATGPLVGRQHEWTKLQQLWEKSAARGPHLVILSGEAGIGKTRLAEELFSWVAQQGLSTARASCYAVEGNLAYAPIGVWLRAAAIRTTFSTLPVLFLTEVARFVPQILVEQPGLPPPGPLSESWQRQRLFEALARAILAARQPLLLLLDDLQWSDRETLEWLHYLLHFDLQARLLIVGTLRAEEMTSEHPVQKLLETLRHEGQLTQMDLGPLTAAETATLATQLARQDLDPELLAQLYHDTEGNALFVVETVRMVLGEAGDAPLKLQGQALGETSAAQEVQLPPTIQAVIAARLAQLSSQAREVVSVAAMIGRAFSFDLLAQVGKMDEEGLLKALDEVWQRRIMREQGGEGYDFSHAKIREVAYAQVPPPRRRLLHRRVAQALEVLHADQLDPVSGDIAAHYEQAGIAERAVIYYKRAAEVAERVYANADAIALYRQALALLDGTTAIGDQHEKIAHFSERVGDLLELIGQHDEAQSAYEISLTSMPKYDRIWQARLHRKIGGIKGWKEDEHVEELHYYDLSETLLGPELPESSSTWWEEWIEIQLTRMWGYYTMAKLPELQALIEKTRTSVEQYGKPMQRAVFFARLTLADYLDSRYMPSEETLHYLQTALAAIQELGDLNAIAEYGFQLGFCYLWRNELGNAEEQLQTALDGAKQVGDLLLQSRCLTYLTITYRKRGLIEKVREYASQALAIATRLPHIGYIVMAKGNMAWVAWREGNIAEAQKHGQAGLEAFDEAGEPFEWTVLWPLIGVAVVQQQLADAIRYVRRLLVPEQQRLPDALTAELEQTIQAWDSNQAERAHTKLQEAIPLAQQMGYL